eukprot:TRINITY_DN25884_c0_g1_i1.p1 TRINITY_DN25884_c0_g1~~TRINITY_DN25884_c0_g1_i1.p1  ORF type:complete len:424 (+),score=71.11 TRINITY_DN25884_c0_g1_i1:29-1273(+)
MQHISNQISQSEVDRRTTLISADGRVVERADGCRLLVDAYNVLHRDYDKLIEQHEELVKEVKRLRREKEGENTAEVVSRLQSLGDEVCTLRAEVAGLQGQASTISAIRLSLADALERLFKNSVDEIGGSEPPAEDTNLHNEVRHLQRSRDRVLMVLTTVASKSRLLETQIKTQTQSNEPPMVYPLQINESEQRSIIVEQWRERVVGMYRECLKACVAKSKTDAKGTQTEQEKLGFTGSGNSGSNNNHNPPDNSGVGVTDEDSLDEPIQNATMKDKKPPVKAKAVPMTKKKSLVGNPLLAGDEKQAVTVDVGGKVLSSTAECFVPGDIIISADGKSVITQQDLITISASSPTGVVTCRVRRSGVTKTVEYRVKRTASTTANPAAAKKKHLTNSSNQPPPRGTVKLRHLNRPATLK